MKWDYNQEAWKKMVGLDKYEKSEGKTQCVWKNSIHCSVSLKSVSEYCANYFNEQNETSSALEQPTNKITLKSKIKFHI